MIMSKHPTMKPNVSRHAQTRMQQRGIARSAVDCLLDYGREHHDHHGAVIVMLDRAAPDDLRDSARCAPASSMRCAGFTPLLRGTGAYAPLATAHGGCGAPRRT